jgi:hypothetical protein
MLAFGYWLLYIGYWMLAIGCWLLAVGYWLLDFGGVIASPSFGECPGSTHWTAGRPASSSLVLVCCLCMRVLLPICFSPKALPKAANS